MVVDVILLVCFEVIGNMALIRFVCWFPGLTDCGALVWVFAPVLVFCCGWGWIVPVARCGCGVLMMLPFCCVSVGLGLIGFNYRFVWLC